MVNLSLPSRTRGNVIRLAVLVLVVALLIPTVVSAFTHTPVGIQPGTIEERPDGRTLISAQGFEERTATSSQKVTRVVSVSPGGLPQWTFRRSSGVRYFYDIDPLANGDVLISAGHPNSSFIRYDPDAGERVWTERLDTDDTHDVDLINGDELVINDMSQDGEDRVFVYNLTTEEITWEYWFANHTDQFPRDAGGEFGGDWTHNNDVEEIRPGVFMVSLKNFNQIVAINRSTKEVVWKLGEPGNSDIVNLQHNPDYLINDAGQPTVIVSDSANDRVAEYTRENGEWNLTWSLVGGDLNEPRDADRLPNGNTLVSDRRGDRLLEVTPTGEVVWEVYAPWQPYDAERLGTVDESSGPTMVDEGVTGPQEMTGSASPDEAAKEDCYNYIQNVTSTRLVPEDDPGPVTAPRIGEEGTDSGNGATGTDENGTDSDSGTDASETESANSDDEGILGTTEGGSSAFGPTALPVVLGLLAIALGAAAVASRTRQ